jgi:dGTPase
VVDPIEGHIFHNRLTHTLEVAQIARRVAEKFVNSSDSAVPILAMGLGGIDPDVVEAAALVHDLGHPPFGHAAEDELNKLVFEKKATDGWEGNAQSFRIVTRLAAHRKQYKGLNLTRATLNAALKYPYYRRKPRESEKTKFGAYDSDEAAFAFARSGMAGEQRTIEAEIMDFADGAAYSVHDLDDSYRAGLIPLDRLENKEVFKRFIDAWKLEESKKPPPKGLTANQIDAGLPDIDKTLGLGFGNVEAWPTFRQRAELRTSTAWLIARLVTNVSLQERDAEGYGLSVPINDRVLMRFLQRLVWVFVITNPALATQQFGQRQIVKFLLNVYCEALDEKLYTIIPPRFNNELEEATTDKARVRLAADIVASFTDSQARLMYGRLSGASSGSLTQLI